VSGVIVVGPVGCRAVPRNRWMAGWLLESAVQDEQEEIARLQREIEDLNRSLGPLAEPTGGE